MVWYPVVGRGIALKISKILKIDSILVDDLEVQNVSVVFIKRTRTLAVFSIFH